MQLFRIQAYNIQMKFLQRDSSSKRPYAKISIKKREQLVKNVMDEGLPISKVAKKLRIKISTARLIIRKYKESGLFYAKQFKARPAKPNPRPQIDQKRQNSKEDSAQDFQQQLRIEQHQISNTQGKEEPPIFQPNPIFFYYVPAWHPLPIYF